MSVPVYFTWVIVISLIGFGAMMFYRPTLAYTVRDLFGLTEKRPVLEESFYSQRVAPILELHCVNCHGQVKQKGKLRLDAFPYLFRGGKHGAIIGNRTEHDLLTRITLPAKDKKVMPPAGKPKMTENEITVLKMWLEAGASGTALPDQFAEAPPPVVRITFPVIDEAVVKQERAALSATVVQLQQKYPGAITYESRSSANIEVNASFLGISFDDDDLAAFMPLTDRIVRMDLSSTAITDTAVAALGNMKQLQALRLVNTQISDAGLAPLVALDELQSLSVMGTAVSTQALQVFADKGIKIYDNSADKGATSAKN